MVPLCPLVLFEAGRGPGGYYDFCIAHGWLSRESGGKHRAACRFLPPPSPRPRFPHPSLALFRVRLSRPITLGDGKGGLLGLRRELLLLNAVSRRPNARRGSEGLLERGVLDASAGRLLDG